jgi:hypothetical protein
MTEIHPRRIEPELLGKRPRRVRMTGSARFAVGCLALFLLPFYLVGAGLIGYSAHGVLVFAAGRTAPSRILEHYWSSSPGGAGEPEIRFTFAYRGKTYVDTDDDRGSRLIGPDTVEVLVSPIRPGFDSKVVPAGYSAAAVLAPRILFTLCWNAFMVAFLVLLRRRGPTERWLYENGIPVVGEVIGMRSDYRVEDSINLKYRFTPAAAELLVGPEAAIESEAPVGSEHINSFREGQQITVLYDPANPARSAPYLPGKYVVLGPGT